MVFVTADSCRAQLGRLTQILIIAFPGSTIYQHTDPTRVPHDVLSHKVDAVLLEAEQTNALDLMQKLRRQKPDLPVFVISQTNNFREEAVNVGANGYFILPDEEQQLLDAIQVIKNKEKAS